MTMTAANPAGLSTLAKRGIAVSLGGLLIPFLGLVAFIIGVFLLIRSEFGPGLGIMALGPVCATLGFLLAIAVGLA